MVNSLSANEYDSFWHAPDTHRGKPTAGEIQAYRETHGVSDSVSNEVIAGEIQRVESTMSFLFNDLQRPIGQ